VPTYTASELAAAVGISEDSTRRFFRALGFPDAGEDIRFTEDDRRVLASLLDAFRHSDVDAATAIRLVRAVGQNVARMSDWQVAALATLAEERDPGESRETGARRLVAHDVQSAMELVLTHAWQRHFDAALTRLRADEEVDETEAASIVTVGFADLVNFSALANRLDTDRLGEIVEIFESRCGDVVAAHEGRLIKTIGDSVLFVVGRTDRAMEIAEGLIDVIGSDQRLPDVRIGLATGPVVTRLGDVFGPPVNLAARLTALARRNRVIGDVATAEALPRSRYQTQRLTARPLRGFGLVEPVAIRPRHSRRS
jgi:adenylate cyclase